IVNAEEAESELGLVVLGVLPKPDRRRAMPKFQYPVMLPEASESTLPTRKADNPAFTEAARALRNALVVQPGNSRMRTVLVTSAVLGEGKTTVAIHTAVMNGLRHQKTLLIDADFTRP